MEVRFEDPTLERLEADPNFTNGMDGALVKAFRKRLQFIRAAADERAFYAMKSLLHSMPKLINHIIRWLRRPKRTFIANFAD